MSNSASKKVLLMGRAGAGKTSMRSIIFANYFARDTKRLTATNQIEQSHLRFLGNLVLSLWDCGGQDTFMENYFESQREHIFRHTEVLIYVLGQNASSSINNIRNNNNKDVEKDFFYFKSTIDSIRQLSPNAKIFCLVHKMDLVKESERARVLETYEKELTKIADKMSITIFGTSIWNESLFQAWSNIVYAIIPNVNILETHLNHFCNVTNADEVVLFEKSTFLVITHVSRVQHHDVHRLEKISNIAKQFKLTCSKSQGAHFENMTIENENYHAILEKFTHNTYILLVTSDKESTTAASLVNIDAGREHFEQIAQAMKYGPSL